MECVSANDLANGVGGLGEAYTAKRFGNLPRACEQGYFEFLHEYSCGPEDEGRDYYKPVSDLGPIDQIRLANIGLGRDDKICEFKPRVQVLDNWGWCNGSCTRVYSQVDGSPSWAPGNYREGRYENFEVALINDDGEIGDYIYPDQCDIQKRGTDPWLYYRGNIIVIPPQINEEEEV